MGRKRKCAHARARGRGWGGASARAAGARGPSRPRLPVRRTVHGGRVAPACTLAARAVEGKSARGEMAQRARPCAPARGACDIFCSARRARAAARCVRRARVRRQRMRSQRSGGPSARASALGRLPSHQPATRVQKCSPEVARAVALLLGAVCCRGALSAVPCGAGAGAVGLALVCASATKCTRACTGCRGP